MTTKCQRNRIVWNKVIVFFSLLILSLSSFWLSIAHRNYLRATKLIRSLELWGTRGNSFHATGWASVLSFNWRCKGKRWSHPWIIRRIYQPIRFANVYVGQTLSFGALFNIDRNRCYAKHTLALPVAIYTSHKAFKTQLNTKRPFTSNLSDWNRFKVRSQCCNTHFC